MIEAQEKILLHVLIDFDGTVTTEDVWDSLWDYYTGKEWRAWGNRFNRNEITYPQLVDKCCEVADFTFEQAISFIREHIQFREGFHSFLQFLLKDPSYAPQIVSGGLDFYIRELLGDLMDSLPVICNTTRFPKGGGIEITLPYYDADYCLQCGNCKGKVVDAVHQSGGIAVVVGDGTTDRCMAKKADYVFARSGLLEWCQSNGVSCTPFETFTELQKEFSKIFPHKETENL